MKPVFFLIISILFSSISFAAGAGITYHGRLIDPNGVPVTSANVQFKLQIRTPGNENCLMYEEVQSKDLSQASGAFAVTINDGTGTRLDTTGYSLDQIFANRNSFTFAGGNCASGSTYTPNASDSRKIQVLFNDGTFAVGLWEPVPPMAINFVPMAIESMQVGGYKKEQLLKIADGVGTAGTELNAAAWTELKALLAGSSTQFIKPGSATFTAAPVWNGTPTTADDLTNKSYVDAQVASLTLPNVGTAGTYTKVTTDTKGRVTSGTTLVEADLPNITTAGKVDGGAINAGTITGTTAINSSGDLYTTGTITGATLVSSALSAYTHGLKGTTSGTVTLAAQATTANYTLRYPAAAPGANQFLESDASGNLTWINRSSITDSSKLPLTGGTMAGDIDMNGNDINNVYLASAAILVGNASNRMAPVAMGGDVTIANNGVTTIGADKVTTGKILDATILGADLDFTGVVNVNSSLVLKDSTGKFNEFFCATAGHVPTWTVTGWACQPTSLSRLSAASAVNVIDNLNFGQVWNWSTATTQYPMMITANALTTGSLLKLTTSSNAVNSTNGLLNVANTGTSVDGVLARFQANSTFNSGLTVFTSGRVGIGTVSPNSKLQVMENASPGTLRTLLELGTDDTTTGTGAAIDFSQGGTVTGKITNIFESGSHVGMGFSTYSLGTTSEKVRISADGNVGIGTPSPGAKLDVKGHIANSGDSASIGTCGTAPSLSGNDMRGVVTLGTGSPTTCTVTFAAAYSTTPICVITPVGGNPGAIQWWVNPSTTELVLNFSAAPTASQQFAYNCVQ